MGYELKIIKLINFTILAKQLPVWLSGKNTATGCSPCRKRRLIGTPKVSRDKETPLPKNCYVWVAFLFIFASFLSTNLLDLRKWNSGRKVSHFLANILQM
jgi:hypothetical protein